MYIIKVALKCLVISTHFSQTAETLHSVFFINLLVIQKNLSCILHIVFLTC